MACQWGVLLIMRPSLLKAIARFARFEAVFKKPHEELGGVKKK